MYRLVLLVAKMLDARCWRGPSHERGSGDFFERGRMHRCEAGDGANESGRGRARRWLVRRSGVRRVHRCQLPVPVAS